MRKNNPPLITQRLAAIGIWGVAGVMVALPFHAFITTWLASGLGNYDLIRSWKEILIAIGAVLAVGIIATDTTHRWKRLVGQTPMKWVLGFAFVTVCFTLLTLTQQTVTTEALLYGFAIQLRFMCFFALVALFSCYNDLLQRYWRQLILGPAVVVLTFGLLQVFVLPYDFLTQFGYGPDTIPAYQTVDNKLDYQRIQSTLRGANPYGTYLVFILSVLVVQLWNRRRSYGVWAMFVATLVNLYFTYSRSAWVAALVSCTIMLLYLVTRQTRKLLVVTGVLLVLLSGTSIWLLRNNDYVQNTLFHSDETSLSEQSSNEQRGQALTASIQDIVQEPLGGGVGSAGPASFRNQPATPRVVENYFIQTGQEMGVVGLVALLGVMVSVALWLHRQVSNRIALVLFASFVGITLINMVSHAWADEIISLLWWGSAGMLMGRGILNKEQTKSKKHDTQTKTRIKTFG